MKTHYKQLSLAKLCSWFGITRQAYYQHSWRELDRSIEAALVLEEVRKLRLDHPRMGGRKLYVCLQDFLQAHQIKMGRDALFDLLAANHLLVRRRRRRVATTNSNHGYRKYRNLIKDWLPDKPNQLWVSDITYWRIAQGFVYISLLTDAYSHKLLGYHLADTLESIHSLTALQMALTSLNKSEAVGLIHHSDRGVQYCSQQYVKLLSDYQIQISMSEDGDPRDNPVAERINGILKQEYLTDIQADSLKEAQGILAEKVKLYNQERPHASISYLTPEVVHSQQLQTQRMWKNYYPHRRTDVNMEKD